MTEDGGAPAAPLPPRGLYPDPGGTRRWRVFDGASWTDQLVDQHPAQVAAVRAGVASEGGRWSARLPTLLLVLAVLATLRGVAELCTLPDQLAYAHYVHQLVDLARHHASASAILAVTPPGVRASGVLAGFAAATSLSSSLTVVLVVLVAVTQRRAMRTARVVGYPVRLRPGAVVLCWCIPLVQLVVPLVAFADCLPPGHRGRRVAVRAGWVAAGVALCQGSVVWSFLHPTRATVLAASMAAAVGTVAWCLATSRLVTEVALDHRALDAALRAG